MQLHRHRRELIMKTRVVLAKRLDALEILTGLVAKYAEQTAQAYESEGRHAEAKEIRRSTAESLHRADEHGVKVKRLIGPVYSYDPDEAEERRRRAALEDDGESSREGPDGAPRGLDDEDGERELDDEPGFRHRGQRAAGRLDGAPIYQQRRKRRPRIM